MKVERPRDKSSDAPTRVQTRSKIGSRAFSAGTKEPICASTAINAI